MTSLTTRNVRMALQSIRATKLRSLLTMLGIIIGVASVITAVSLGEGVRKQVAGNIDTSGQNVISIRPGKLVNRSGDDDEIRSINYAAAIGPSTLTDLDLQSITKLKTVKSTAPLSTISGIAKDSEGHEFEGIIIGTNGNFPALTGQKVLYGDFFKDSEYGHNSAIIGKTVAEELYKQNVPIGQSLSIRDHEFIVGGIFDSFTANSLSNGADLNRAIFIPYQTARSISSNAASLYQILVEPRDESRETARAITKALKQNHGGQEDFAVLTGAETLRLAGQALTTLTSFVAGIAAISLIVGGIGIMNIMFVSVTERTREIGVRKSIGATNRQIYTQFLVEATIVSLVGGIIGTLLALFSNFCITVLTNMRPVATIPIILLAVGSSTVVGILFGTAPAIKAARKDPIESLRYE